MKILDVGCGMKKYKSENPKDDVIGIDINKDSQADVLHDLNKFPWPFKESEFDMTFSSHCIEHLDDWLKVLREIVRITKPNGTIIFMVPHFSSAIAYTVEHKSYFTCLSFTGVLPRLKLVKGIELEKIELRYLKSTDDRGFFHVLINKILTGLANSNLHFCERVWCYWVGGFNEIYLRYRVVK